MKTLIELYDERPLENILAAEVLRPEQVIYLCPQEVVDSPAAKKSLTNYFAHRGIACRTEFISSSQYNVSKILRQLNNIMEQYPDCVLDITGGTDAALYAGGVLGGQKDIPVFTYSRKRNRFFNIANAAFVEEAPCEVSFSVEDCFLMAGGAMREGRVDNSVLSAYLSTFDGFFSLYLRFRRSWSGLVNWMQRASQVPKGEPIPLEVDAAYIQKGDRGERISADPEALRALQELGYIRNLSISGKDRVSFTFKDEQIRTWLRDQGSVLELYVYKECLQSGLFHEVRTSAVVDWEGDFQRDNVTNELDVMCVSGITPAFISCKTCEIKTEAINELAILRDRFGNGIARSAIVSTEYAGTAARRRAHELDIQIIDLNDLKEGSLLSALQTLMQPE